MGLSNFPTTSDGLLPMLAVTVVYVFSLLKKTAKYLRLSVEDELEVVPPTVNYYGQGRISVRRFKAAEEAEECCVCLNRFKGDEEVSELVSCKHFFHRWCLERWFDNCLNATTPCPLCRSLL